jgi:hypothetical protein
MCKSPGKVLAWCSCLLFLAGSAHAADHLLYFEAQGVLGYSSAQQETIPYSMNPEAEMQKPSVGFDYLKRFSGESGDVATFALQYRLALVEVGEDGYKSEAQVYNAYLKVKTPLAYVWVGHNRPALGLGSYFDSHGLLLRTLPIQGFGYDRDWGIGLYRDLSWGDVAATVTTGSGMPARVTGDNSMTAARISYGVLSQDNWNLGLSAGTGRTLDTMGYTMRDNEPRRMQLAGADLAILRDNLEHRFDALAGKWLGRDTFAYFYRLSVNLSEENRVKIEAQPTYWKFGEERNYQLALCLTVLATSDLTVRTAYVYDDLTNDNRFLLQLYYYVPL